MTRESPYAEPQNITDINDCIFYHVMDLPEYGTVGMKDTWDLRGKEADYLGHADFKGKTVLELGAASGHLCFWMEKQGADVTAYDMSPKEEWDIIPFAKWNYRQYVMGFQAAQKNVNNAFWLAHRLYSSHAKLVLGTVYKIPEEIGMFDISVYASILLHLRDPFLALQQGLAHTKETVIITERVVEFDNFTDKKAMHFIPNSQDSTFNDKATWWSFHPELLIEWVKILGFEHCQVTHHSQSLSNNTYPFYTVVAKREIGGI